MATTTHNHHWVFLYAGSRDGNRYKVYGCRCGLQKTEQGR